MADVLFVMTTIGATAMNLQIRDPLAHELARELAEKRKITLTEAVIVALKAELEKENSAQEKSRSLVERHAFLAEKLKALGAGEGREMTKDEIDEMWGH
jgi:antitoxin VapB